MSTLTSLLAFSFCLVCVNSVELDELYTLVSSKLEETEHYQVPTNNEKLFKVNDSKVYDAGSYDFIIVGAGASGSVLANRLSEISTWKILLLEAGGKTNKFSDIPMFGDDLRYSDMNWGYYTSPQTRSCQGMRNNQCVYPRGKVIGGTTTMNSAVYARGAHTDYKNWEAMGNQGWAFKHVFPYFKKSESCSFKSCDPHYHGTTGPLSVNQTSPPSIIANAFVNANREKGLNLVDYNGKQQIGVSRIQSTIKYNIHHNSEHAFLDYVKSRKNLKIMLNAAVNKILLKSHIATGVTFVKDGAVYTAKARKEVILSAGAINSPQLLLLSGLGPKEELKKLSIPVVAHLPAVGKNLQDHPLLFNIYFRTNLTAQNRTLKENLARYLKDETPYTNAANLEHIAFINVGNISSGSADIQYLTSPPPFGVPSNPVRSLNFKYTYAHAYKSYNPLTDLSVFMSLLKPKSRGQVTLKSNNIVDFPIIDLNFFSDVNGTDIETMYKGIQYILSLTKTEAFKRINATLISEHPSCNQFKGQERKYWYCALKYMTATEYHPSCTTRMGTSRRDSVVNKDCMVHSFTNLRVVDAGVMPEITRSSIAAAIYMIAEKISDEIKRNHGKLH
ncbi:glucose dehydrogenase [FAD, quinone]-like [Diabrotica virgifera virgifera]|uniref:Glucose dehydrogenase [FAD, quinone]-like n=1 Tax=Diabrotica virgifera virgifera TaxID=50390 RepID=A0A6P7GNF8_DIAVI|nr:glucose dehydrogenase [FAD, quinone]-like [Diabrotica virgifera virgifera]